MKQYTRDRIKERAEALSKIIMADFLNGDRYVRIKRINRLANMTAIYKRMKKNDKDSF